MKLEKDSTSLKMTKKISFTFANQSNLSEIQNLLKQNKLPFEDIETSKVVFIVAVADNQLIGSIGIEEKEGDGLLRSFAVTEEYKNKGVGTKLFNELIKYTISKGIYTLHILTTSAENYFSKKGFKKVDRKMAPLKIQQTTEFSTLCPSSSIYMTLSNINNNASVTT